MTDMVFRSNGESSSKEAALHRTHVRQSDGRSAHHSAPPAATLERKLLAAAKRIRDLEEKVEERDYMVRELSQRWQRHSTAQPVPQPQQDEPNDKLKQTLEEALHTELRNTELSLELSELRTEKLLYESKAQDAEARAMQLYAEVMSLKAENEGLRMREQEMHDSVKPQSQPFSPQPSVLNPSEDQERVLRQALERRDHDIAKLKRELFIADQRYSNTEFTLQKLRETSSESPNSTRPSNHPGITTQLETMRQNLERFGSELESLVEHVIQLGSLRPNEVNPKTAQNSDTSTSDDLDNKD